MLMMAKEAGVSRFFYSSSACVYAADKQTNPNLTALKEEDAYPAMPEDGYGWEKLFFRTNVPALSRRLRVGNPRCALSQRLSATGNLC
jgi:nucleoside-diphosphate-sugar epimerase